MRMKTEEDEEDERGMVCTLCPKDSEQPDPLVIWNKTTKLLGQQCLVANQLASAQVGEASDKFPCPAPSLTGQNWRPLQSANIFHGGMLV